MGYAQYDIARRDGSTITAGYAVEAECERDGCTRTIHRGLDALCGETPTGEHGCGGYFCEQELGLAPEGQTGWRCTNCLQTSEPQDEDEEAPAYFPTPLVARLAVELGIAQALSGLAGGDFHPDFRASQHRTALLLRAVIADLFALAQDDTRAAADAARAALAVRQHDQLSTRITTAQARQWLRQEYIDWEKHPSHHPLCPGGCGGTGTMTRTNTWQDNGVPLDQGPADCDRGKPEDPHPTDCACLGTGRLPDPHAIGEMTRCHHDGAAPVEPEPQHAYATPSGNPWDAAPL